MTQQLTATIIEALSLYKEQISDINEIIELLKDETNNNQKEIIKTKEVLEKQLEDLVISTSKMINDVIAKIPKDVSVDYGRIEASIKAKINRYIREKDSDISDVRTELKSFIKTIIPKDGKDGKDADNEAILSDLKQYINNNNSFKGRDGKDGIGKDGVDGVGIKDIYEKKDYLYIKLTNGDIKKFKLPVKKTVYGGGGNSDLDISKLTEVDTLLPTDYLVIIRDNKTYKILASKVGGGSNIPSNAVYDGSEVIYYNGEIVTDGEATGQEPVYV